MAIVTLSIMSLKANSFTGFRTPVKSSKESTIAKVDYVYPNPESGTLNLLCCPGLISPLSLKVIDRNGSTRRTIQSLTVAGKSNHSYVQFTTSGIDKGEYKIVVSDVTGKTFSRKIFLEK